LRSGGVENSKESDCDAEKAANTQDQTENSSNDLRSTPPSNENKMSDGHRDRAWTGETMLE
jgi:hypothetical protein